MTKSDWTRFRPSPQQPWNWQRVVHLHRRAGFGATWAEVQRDVAGGLEASIDRLLNGASRVSGQRDDFEAMAAVIGDAAVNSNDPNRLKAWWLFRTLFTPDPLREKLTLFWHNFFATSNLKVRDLAKMRTQNQLIRENVFEDFGQLLSAVVKDPALLIWLDANLNRQGRPNENLARELMELFTLGIGNYREIDVKQAARCLTGWTVRRGEFHVATDRHDPAEKVLLSGQRAANGDDLLAMLVKHPATSQRLAHRLVAYFLGERVATKPAIDTLAVGLRQRGLDLRWAIETILRSELFFAQENMASRVSCPVEFVVGSVRSLEMMNEPPSTLTLAEWCTRMGQDLFYPPNVGGWSGGRHWLSTRTIVARTNFVAALVVGQLRVPVTPPDLDSLLAAHGIRADRAHSQQWFARLLLGRDVKELNDRIRFTFTGGSEHRELSQSQAAVARVLSRPDAYLI